MVDVVVDQKEEANDRDDQEEEGGFDYRQESLPTRREVVVEKSVCFGGNNNNNNNNSIGNNKIFVSEFVQTASSSGSSNSSGSFSLAAEESLTKLENVTAISRSLIPQFEKKVIMATQTTTDSNNNNNNNNNGRKGIFRKRLSLRRGGSSALATTLTTNEEDQSLISTASNDNTVANQQQNQQQQQQQEEQNNNNKSRSRGVLQRLRSASLSRSRSRSRAASSDLSSGDNNNNNNPKPMLVAVTSCRSDAYYNQKAPGSTSKLPRKAPSNLKLFHELAVGVKDAYQAVGQTPTRPDDQENEGLTPQQQEGRQVLWDFVGNLDFVSIVLYSILNFDTHYLISSLSSLSLQLLALVDEVATDTATRGALKDDSTFKSLRDVIKKCNKVLESMLVRRERRYTLFFRLVQPHEAKEVSKIKAWNAKVEKAVGTVTESPETESEAGDSVYSATDGSTKSGVTGMIHRGRQMLPTAGKVRARRATPTPTLRNRQTQNGAGSATTTTTSTTMAAEDGFATSTMTAPITKGNLALLQRSINNNADDDKKLAPPMLQHQQVAVQETLAPVKPMEAKEELIDVIKGLRTEKLQKRDGTHERFVSLCVCVCFLN